VDLPVWSLGGGGRDAVKSKNSRAIFMWGAGFWKKKAERPYILPTEGKGGRNAEVPILPF